VSAEASQGGEQVGSAELVAALWLATDLGYKVCDAVAGSTPSLSASRVAISGLCNPCSNGKPIRAHR
jgi:hypothetical protein